MKMSLTITASASVLAGILANIPDDDSVVVGVGGAVTAADILQAAAAAAPNAMDQMAKFGAVQSSTPTGTSTPVVPAMPSAPTMPAPTMPAFSPPAASEEEPDGPAPTGDVDSNGIRWDERIHSGAKTTTAAGAWKKRKGVDAALIQAVEAEQRGAPAGAAAAAAVMPVAPPVMPLAAPVPMPSVVPPVAMPPMVAPAAPVAPVTDAPIDFMGLLGHVAKLTEAQRVDATYLADLVQRITAATGTPLNSLVDLNGKPELIAYTVQVMQHDQRW